MSLGDLVQDETAKPEGVDADPKVAVWVDSNPSSTPPPVVTAPSPNQSTEPTEVSSVNTAADKAQQITDQLLSRMAPVGEKANFKILIYGPPGGSKSSFLNIKNNLIFDQEDGLISMKSWAIQSGKPLAENIMSIPFRSFGQADVLLDRLTKRIPELDSYDCFSIDTMNDFHRKSLMSIVKKQYAESPNSRNEWIPVVDQHQENNEKILDFVRRLRDLDRNVILTAHSKTVEPKDSPAKTYPDFSESLANKIEAMMDIVGYMEMREEDGEYFPVLRIKSNGIVHAKSRVPLPPLIKNPSYQMLLDAWQSVIDYTG